MGIWVDILNRAASGDQQGARELLDHTLPLALRYPAACSEASSSGCRYKGPLADRVAVFIANLPPGEQETARGLEPDLVNAVLATLVSQVRRSMLLIEFCWSHPGLTLGYVPKIQKRFMTKMDRANRRKQP
jgi:hypothetical protein